MYQTYLHIVEWLYQWQSFISPVPHWPYCGVAAKHQVFALQWNDPTRSSLWSALGGLCPGLPLRLVVVGWLVVSGKRQKEWWVPRQHDPNIQFLFWAHLSVSETFWNQQLPVSSYLTGWPIKQLHFQPLQEYREKLSPEEGHWDRGSLAWWKGPWEWAIRQGITNFCSDLRGWIQYEVLFGDIVHPK